MLAEWLQHAESCCRYVSEVKPPKRRKRTFLTAFAKAILEESFLQNAFPAKKERFKLGLTIGVTDERVIKNWFVNKRRRERSF